MIALYVFACWSAAAGCLACLIAAVAHCVYGDDSLRMLDGTRFADAGYEQQERLSMELDYVLSLEAREPRA